MISDTAMTLPKSVLNPTTKYSMYKLQNEWIKEYQARRALYIHDGNPKHRHPVLTSGKHSNGFFNNRLVIAEEHILRMAASDLLELFHQRGGNIWTVDGVVGPQTGATKLAKYLSEEIMSFTRKDCFSASPAKKESNGTKAMAFSRDELSILPGQMILPCEDALSTGGSVDRMVTAVTNAGGVTVPFILVLVNRSGLSEVDGKKIVSLIDQAMPMWMPDECPLCKQGSRAVEAAKDNWDLLTGV